MTILPDTNENADASDVPPQMPGDHGGLPKGPRRRILKLAAAGLVLVALVAGIFFYLHAISHESTDDAFIDGSILSISPRVSGHVARVFVADNQKVAAGDLLVEIDARDFEARLAAAKAALQSAEASNRSHSIDVNLTSITAAASLDEATAAVDAARAMVQNAQALAAAAKSRHGETQAQVAFAKAALEQTRAEIQAEEANYQLTAQDLKRNREMARSNTISPQQLDRAVTAERVAAAGLEAAKSKLDTQQAKSQQANAALKSAEDNVRQAQAQVTARQAQLEQANARLASARSAPELVARSSSLAEESKADMEKARAEVRQATLNLSYTRIVAPADGYVTKKNIDPGAFVQVGQALMAIVSPRVWVTANFKETQLTRMRPGQPATVSVDAFPGVTFHSRVESIQRGTGSRFSLLPPENATGNFVKVVQRIPVKIVFQQPEELAAYMLVPGMSVIPTVIVAADGEQPAATRTDVSKTDDRPLSKP
jgi:membrane fusion protein (multidrug efflux system)